MNCKDCVHYEVCKDYVESALDGLQYNDSQMNGDDCEFFKDRSRFVELPCKIGDFAYFIKARRVMADIVSKFTIDKCGVMLQRVNGYNLGYTDQLGKKLFLTCEEADAALKGRENNG